MSPELYRGSGTYGRGEGNPNYQGGRIVTDRGYVRITTGRRSNNQPYEHRLVIERLMLEQAILEATANTVNIMQDRHGYPEPEVVAQAVLCAIRPIILDPPEIPAHMNIHHQNMDGADNRPANLLLLDKAIHVFITQDHRRYVRKMEREQMMAKLRGEG